jgi:hypothetical protein
MEIDEWEPIHGFHSPDEYNSFIAYVEEQVKSGLVVEIEYDPTCGVIKTAGERWFQNARTRQVWKLLVPDPGYFRGAWVPVERRLFDER